MKNFPFEPNTSIHRASLLEHDLIPAFIGALEVLDADRAEKFRKQYENARPVSESDDIPYLLEDLFDVLNEHCPKGIYFGAHPGDGSDFGFWEDEEEE